MIITGTRLTPGFAARIDGADIIRPLDDATWAAIRAAFEEHSVLVFRDRRWTTRRRSPSATASARSRSPAA